MTPQGRSIPVGTNRLLAWAELRKIGNEEAKSNRFPILIDTGFNGFVAIRWEVLQDCLGCQFIPDIRPAEKDPNFKVNQYGAYLNANLELHLCEKLDSKGSIRLASSSKIQVYFPPSFVLRNRDRLKDPSTYDQARDNRPTSPILGMLAIDQSMTTLVVKKDGFVLSRWPWKSP